MVENNNDTSRNLEKVLQALEQANSVQPTKRKTEREDRHTSHNVLWIMPQ